MHMHCTLRALVFYAFWANGLFEVQRRAAPVVLRPVTVFCHPILRNCVRQVTTCARRSHPEGGVQMKTLLKSAVAAIALTTLGLTSASAETRITYKSAKTGSSYYQMGVELAEAMKAGGGPGGVATTGAKVVPAVPARAGDRKSVV